MLENLFVVVFVFEALWKIWSGFYRVSAVFHVDGPSSSERGVPVGPHSKGHPIRIAA